LRLNILVLILNHLRAQHAGLLGGVVERVIKIVEVVDSVDDSRRRPSADDVIGVFRLEPGGKSSGVASSDQHPVGLAASLLDKINVLAVNKGSNIG